VLELAERAYFRLCLIFGSLLRAGRYSKARIVSEHGELRVRKHRRFYAPLLVWLGDPLLRILDTGVRVLPQRDWEEREREMYRRVYRMSVEVAADGVLILPYLPGKTLAELLEDSVVGESGRERAVELAVEALGGLHSLGLTHGDAMAENVLVDLDAGIAQWFDFETVHDANRSMAWRRADDLRALLGTCVVRTRRDGSERTIDLILDAYAADPTVTRLLAASFGSVWRRPLTFHLGQARLSLEAFRELGAALAERGGSST
jgi:tRNA A-37 threonylcarbamoyl transferase component Bud32